MTTVNETTSVYIELDRPDHITELLGVAEVVQGAALVITQPNGDTVGYPLARVLSWAQTWEKTR